MQDALTCLRIMTQQSLLQTIYASSAGALRIRRDANLLQITRRNNYVYLIEKQGHRCFGDYCNRALIYQAGGNDRKEYRYVSLGNYLGLMGNRTLAKRLGLDVTQVSGYCPQFLISHTTFNKACLDALSYTSHL